MLEHGRDISQQSASSSAALRFTTSGKETFSLQMSPVLHSGMFCFCEEISDSKILDIFCGVSTLKILISSRTNTPNQPYPTVKGKREARNRFCVVPFVRNRIEVTLLVY